MAALSGKQVKQYFDYPQMRSAFIWLLIIGIATVAIKGFGLIPLAIAALIGWFKLRGVPSDQDIEDTYSEYVTRKEPDALNDLNFSKDELVRESQWFWFVSNGLKGYPKRYRTGKDKILRANTRSFMMVFYGQDQIMSFEIDYNIESQTQSRAENSEYFYRDVAGVEVTARELTLRTMGGNKSFPLSRERETADENKAKGVMNSVRAMLREKKRDAA